MKNIEKKLLLLAIITFIITGCKTQEQTCSTHTTDDCCKPKQEVCH